MKWPRSPNPGAPPRKCLRRLLIASVSLLLVLGPSVRERQRVNGPAFRGSPDRRDLCRRRPSAVAEGTDQPAHELTSAITVGLTVGSYHPLEDALARPEGHLAAVGERGSRRACWFCFSCFSPVSSARRSANSGSPVRPRHPREACCTRQWQRSNASRARRMTSKGSTTTKESRYSSGRLTAAALNPAKPSAAMTSTRVPPGMRALREPLLEQGLRPVLGCDQRP
jgi:hypothetical protein